MHIHFIAIGGSAMHNLAIALAKKGYHVTGSDDEIFEPSKTRLQQHGLLPQQNGWHPENIDSSIDAVILGMHAREDNPELQKAKELNLKIYSYPEYLYQQTIDKKRIVIGGSHGKTTITSMVMHVLKDNGIKFDYMVGANLEGFDTMVSLQNDTKLAVFEGDEYLSSPIDRRPKFHLYHPHIALLSGVAWDHINVFPTFDNYVDQFKQFVNKIEPQGKFIYFEQDSILKNIAKNSRPDIYKIPYTQHPAKIENGITFLQEGKQYIPLHIFGAHNLQNLEGARLICKEIGINDKSFYHSIASFNGAARRLQLLAEHQDCSVFYDFAHSPSKLKATTKAVKQQFPKRKLVAVMELHTFSSLQKNFLPHYKHCMQEADEAYVFYNPETLVHKKLPPIHPDEVTEAFNQQGLKVFTNPELLFKELFKKNWQHQNLLIMTSGNFSGQNIPKLAQEICGSI